jgi:hypothetical protein
MFRHALLIIHVWLGNWWALGILFILTSLVFAVVVPRAKARIFAAVTTDLPKRVLDEYMMTWRARDAERFFRDIGPQGREAYRVFYRRTDFWFPGLIISLLYVSFLSLAFPPNSSFAWVAILGFAGWPFDLAENVNHYRMSRSYPQLTTASLSIGPMFTLTKWLLTVVLPLAGLRDCSHARSNLGHRGASASYQQSRCWRIWVKLICAVSIG